MNNVRPFELIIICLKPKSNLKVILQWVMYFEYFITAFIHLVSDVESIRITRGAVPLSNHFQGSTTIADTVEDVLELKDHFTLLLKVHKSSASSNFISEIIVLLLLFFFISIDN